MSDQITDKERLMRSLQAVADFLCETEPRVGDALFAVECIKMNMEDLEVYNPRAVAAIYDGAFPIPKGDSNG